MGCDSGRDKRENVQKHWVVCRRLPSSHVLITPPQTVQIVASDFYAKVAQYNVERKILKLASAGSRREDRDAYVNHVLRVGSTIACSDGHACAKIQQVAAEWTLNGTVASLAPSTMNFLARSCGGRSGTTWSGPVGEHDGGWLRANRSSHPHRLPAKPSPSCADGCHRMNLRAICKMSPQKWEESLSLSGE